MLAPSAPLALLALTALVVGLGGATLARAASEKGEGKEPRKQYKLTEFTAKKINAVIESLNAEDYDLASELLLPLSKKEKRHNPYERALVYQMQGYVASARNDFRTALGYFVKSLRQDALPDQAQASLRFNVAQLYVAEERYEEAVATLEVWFGEVEKPIASAYYLFAISHYELGHLAAAIPAINKAIELSREPNEGWYQFLVGLLFETKAYADAVDPLEHLIALNPKKSYWTQLSALYNNLGNEVRSLAVYQLAYEANLIEQDSELRQLAQLYLYHEMPYPAAKLLANAIESKQIEPNEKVWEMLANSWLLAREHDLALPALEQAARLSDVGDTYARIGQVHVQNESWTDATESLAKALDKGGLQDEANVNLLMGISFYHQKKSAAARKHFVAAKEASVRGGTARKSAVQWLSVLDRERS